MQSMDLALSNQEDIKSTLSSSYAGANIGGVMIASAVNSRDLPNFLASRMNGTAQANNSQFVGFLSESWPYFAASVALVGLAVLVRRVK